MKKIFSIILCIALITSTLCGCSSDEKIGGSLDSKAKLAEDFYRAFYTGDLEGVSECCPPILKDYLLRITRNADYGIYDSVAIELKEPKKASISELQHTEESYFRDAGVTILIEEGYFYPAKVTLYYENDRSDDRSTHVIVLVAKIDGQWYAFPE